ncbi:type IV pilus modification PilV family protein [Pseudoduganella sp. OTU4001]|uniref:type IV pilus modification PilV family protein n=1 Tax=Pseudoduganella sp. OTU4001 TaxID=3043854 RepID=UPI00313E1155
MNTIKYRKQGGGAMVEAIVAVILLAVGLIGTVGMQARSYAAINDAGMRAEATLAADRLIGIMNNDYDNIDNYAFKQADKKDPASSLKPWLAETMAMIPGAGVDVVVARGATQTQVDITIAWQRRKGDEPNKHSMTTYIMNPRPL